MALEVPVPRFVWSAYCPPWPGSLQAHCPCDLCDLYPTDINIVGCFNPFQSVPACGIITLPKMNISLGLLQLLAIIISEKIVSSEQIIKEKLDELDDINLLLYNLKYFIGGQIEDVSKECSFVIMSNNNGTKSG